MKKIDTTELAYVCHLCLDKMVREQFSYSAKVNYPNDKARTIFNDIFIKHGYDRDFVGFIWETIIEANSISLLADWISETFNIDCSRNQKGEFFITVNGERTCYDGKSKTSRLEFYSAWSKLITDKYITYRMYNESK